MNEPTDTREVVALHPIFKDCCADRKSHRYDLTAPFVAGDYIVATDGPIMVRCPRGDTVLDVDPERWLPDPRGIWEAVSKRGETVSVTLPDVPGEAPCDVCKGTGIVDTGILLACDGIEYQIHQHGKPIWYDCLECEGAKEIRSDEAVLVHKSGYHLRAYYIAVLRRHGVMSVEIPLKRPKSWHDNLNACSFVGDGFEGWLMPIVPERTSI